MTIAVIGWWSWEFHDGHNLFVVIESECHVLGIWTTITFQSTINGLQSSTECGRVGMNISIPEPSSSGPSNSWIVGNLIGVGAQTKIAIQRLGSCLVVVAPSQLKASTSVEDSIWIVATVVIVSIGTSLHVGLTVLFLHV